MNYYWLNQRSSDDSNYDDDIGRVYHYRGNTPGAHQLEEGDLVVYYQPSEYVLFGAGRVRKIAREKSRVGSDSDTITNYYAHIENYVHFEPEILLKGVGESTLKDEISFLKGKEGLRGVPQHSIHEMNQQDYERVLEVAGVDINTITNPHEER